MDKKKNNSLKKVLIVVIWLVMALGATSMFIFYRYVMQPNLAINKPSHFYIPTGSTYNDVYRLLTEQELLKRPATFNWLSEKKNYHNRVLPGRYLLMPGMGNNALINLLRSGKQDPLMLTFNNIRTKEQLASVISQSIETDSVSIMALFNDEVFLAEYGHHPETALLLFIPNTYEFFWNTSARQLFDRMAREYNRYWNDQRLALAERIGLTPVEAMILASIVQRETTKAGEMARIAGVYINRLNRNMLLQADPTVVYAVGDFSINRVLNRHLAIDSPYNTYKYPGLPPGPIGLPEPQTIDFVLNHEAHDYLFFCARDDFSGYHAFASTYSEHLANARRYHRALNQRQIMR